VALIMAIGRAMVAPATQHIACEVWA